MDFSKIKTNLQQVAKDMIPVVLGILIALWINNWQKTKDDQAFIKHVFSAIEEEHQENIAELKEVIVLHEQLTDSIDFYLENDELFIGEFMQMTKGLKFALIGNTSWKSFIGSDFKLIDFKLIKNLSLIDEYRVAYDNQVKRMTDFIFSNIRSTKTDDKEILFVIIRDLIYTEKKILEIHEETEQFLKNNK